MQKPGITRRELPLALAGSLGVSAAILGQEKQAPDEDPQPDDPLQDPVILQLLMLDQQYELTDADRAAIVPRLHRQRLRSDALKEFPLSSGAEPATVFLADPLTVHGGDADADQ